MKHRNLIALVLVLACVGCPQLQNLSRVIMNVNVFSTQEEVQFGQQLSAEIEKEMKVLDDPKVQDHVRRIGRKIAAKAPRQDVEYHFTVIDNIKEVNAFAGPGGYVYVYTGLLKKVSDDNELAGVLAHEVGHVSARHSMKQMTKRMGFDAISKMLLGEDAQEWQVTATQMVSGLGFLSFSRKQEYEADELGVQIMNAAGYDARGLLRFLDKLVAMRDREPSAVERMLATHPAPSERRARVATQLRAMGLAHQPVQPQLHIDR